MVIKKENFLREIGNPGSLFFYKNKRSKFPFIIRWQTVKRKEIFISLTID